MNVSKYTFPLEGTGHGVSVAVIDSGWSMHQPSERVGSGIDLTGGFADHCLPNIHDKLGHGTMCGDILFRVAPQVNLHPVKIFKNNLNASPTRLIQALQWAVENEMSVVNLSASTLLEEAIDPLYRVCDLARKANVTVVAAAHAQSEWSYPAVFDNVIGVRQKLPVSPNAWYERPQASQVQEGLGRISVAVQPYEAVECTVYGGHRNVRVSNGVAKRVASNSSAVPVIAGLVARLKQDAPHASLSYLLQTLHSLSTK